MKKTRIAIVGLGMAVTPHAKGLMDLSDTVEVAYAHSPERGRAGDAFSERFPFPTCDSFDTILEDKSVEAVAVLTPANTHLRIARRCAAAGKHVLLEKPIDITTAKAEATIAACRQAGVTLGIVLQHRFRPAGMRLAELLACRRAWVDRRHARQLSACGARKATMTSQAAAVSREMAAACCSRRASTPST